jgi:hypothetical protein
LFSSALPSKISWQDYIKISLIFSITIKGKDRGKGKGRGKGKDRGGN